jgi:hypothetical protein
LSLKQRINRLRREVAALEEDQQPVVVLLYGNPEPTRLLGRQMSSREAMIGTEVFSALDGESEGQFHRRLASIARERIVGLDRKITIISICSEEPVKVARFNADGTPLTIN